MSNKVAALVIALLAFSLINSACNNLPPECEKFFDLPTARREAEFKTYPIDKQLDLYMCGMSMEPSQIGLSGYIAANGDKNIPLLLQRLKMERYENRQEYILVIFSSMAAQGRLKGRQDVVDQLESVVSAMRLAPIKERAQEDLEVVKKNL
ncbi:MAG TPA: hypothetical protein VE732_09035 [Nitrososphaera sp.]|nr:hypothetical protein [Nitrososphaera sp.]